MKKQELITIIIACILAIFVFYGFYIKKYNTLTKPSSEQEVIINEDNEELITEEEPSVINENKVEEENLPAKTISKSKTPENNSKTYNKQTVIEEQTETKTIVKTEEPKTVDCGIVQEKESGAIIITKEFAIKSPAKYSFK